MKTPFLTAEWRKLALANYAVDPALLQSFVPRHTELDTWNGVCYVSLVGFMFLNTRLKGVAIPFHRHFEEVNLRFYVRHFNGEEWLRGVVFIKEIVPKPAITLVANTIYKEHYETLRMKHRWQLGDSSQTIQYAWKKDTWHQLALQASSSPMDLQPGSEEEFITEHYWGYSAHDAHTIGYKVEHPRWQVYEVQSHDIQVDFGKVYGSSFAALSQEQPLSVFLAEGSLISVGEKFRV